MLATNVMSACRAQLIHNLYTVCVFIFTAPGCMFGERILPQLVVKCLITCLSSHNTGYPNLAASPDTLVTLLLRMS